MSRKKPTCRKKHAATTADPITDETLTWLLLDDYCEMLEMEKAIEEAWPKIPFSHRRTVTAQIAAILHAAIEHKPEARRRRRPGPELS